jgi:hypothetical protein
VAIENEDGQTTPPAETTTPPATPPPAKVFTQAEVEAMIKDRLKRGGINPDERARLEQLEADRTARERSDAEAKREYDRAVRSVREEAEGKVKVEQERASKLLEVVKREKVQGTWIAASAKLGAIDSAQVAKLLDDRASFNPDTLTVTYLDEAGNPGYKNGNPWTAEDVLVSFREKNKHLFKAAEGSGSGAQGSAANSDNNNQAADIDTDEKKLVDAWTEATTKAQKGGPMEVTAAHVAKRKLDQYRAEKRKALIGK